MCTHVLNNMIHNIDRAGKFQAKCKRASKHFNVEALEKESKLIEQLKRKKD